MTPSALVTFRRSPSHRDDGTHSGVQHILGFPITLHELQGTPPWPVAELTLQSRVLWHKLTLMISSSPSFDWTYSEDKAEPLEGWPATIAKALPTGYGEERKNKPMGTDIIST